MALLAAHAPVFRTQLDGKPRAILAQAETLEEWRRPLPQIFQHILAKLRIDEIGDRAFEHFI